MKKSLLAVAAMTAFAGAAQAQSSVTVYGILDVGFAGTAGRATTPAGVTTKTNATQFSGTGSETTSRLGFKGTEDLGGGTSAFFTAEFQLYPTDYNLSGNTQGGLFNRQTFVGLKKNGIGQASIGTQYTPMHSAVGRNQAGQQNNMIGSIIYAQGANGSGQTSTSYTVRLQNALNAQTDRMAGFVVSGQYAQQGTDTTISAGGTTGGNVNNSGWGLGVNYVWKKLNVDAVYQSVKNITDNGTTLATAALPTGFTRTASGTPFGTNITDNQTFVGANYDFGILKAYAAWINRKATSGVDSNQYLTRSGQEIGVRSFITPKIEGWANAGTGRYQSFGASQPTVNFNAWQLGSNYWLSKRTNAYAIYGQTLTSSTPLGGNAAGSSYAVGVRHTF
jgi:predicted porin